ncbi:Ricin B, lectin domain containing protein [Quillaja saponaria]|uniref:Ricin B, lectin domain containing protein n=1 Tax=Quillaja saponaria TaxID=32244 RepID=A0AAD7Q7L4_QUISA|nr:Ricin B, lectin domain containing protein [Quillaja saponaria]
MEFPYGHESHTHHTHHHKRDEEREGYPPPGATLSSFDNRPHPPPPSYYGVYERPPPPPSYYGVDERPPPPPSYYGVDERPPPPPPIQPTHVYHTTHVPPPQFSQDFNHSVFPPPPPPHHQVDSFNHTYQSEIPPPPIPAYPPANTTNTVHHVSHELHRSEDHHSHRPHLPSFVHHETHKVSSELLNRPTVKIFSKAEPNYSLTIWDGKVVLAISNPRDEFQHWYKDEKYSTRVKDEEGCPCFSLVNKATGLAIKHSIGATHPVRLIPYNPDYLDESVLWTESKDLGDGFRAVRMVNNVHLNVDAFHW